MITPELDGRTVLVTGSAKGIGRAAILAIAECGARVAVHYRTSAGTAEEVADRARDRGAADVTTVQGDVTDPGEVDGMVGAVETELGSVDVLVNNVGTFAPEHWSAMDLETWNRVLKTNLNGTYLCSKRVLSGMREEGFGRIVNVGYASSEKAMVSPTNTPYVIAKTGVLMFTRMLAADTADDGITVNAISPYVVENSEVFPDELPRGRPAWYEDVIHALFTFLDEGSGYISGTNIEVDGGWLPETV